MNVRHPVDVLRSFSVKNIFMIKWIEGFFIFAWRLGSALNWNVGQYFTVLLLELFRVRCVGLSVFMNKNSHHGIINGHFKDIEVLLR